MTRSFGVDLGGTNVRVGLVQRPGGVLDEEKLHVGDRAPEAVADLVAEAVNRLAARSDATAAPVGVGVAGMLRGATGVVENAPNLGWRGVDLRALLARRLGQHEVVLANDVDAIAYGEYHFGAGQGVHDLLCIYAGTGIGGGIVAGGRLVTGASGIAAEIGHTKVVYGKGARLCGCGQHGCLEAYCGGRKLQERARAELRAGASSLAVALAGGDPDAVHPGHLDEAARQGDPYAVRLWDEIGPLFGLVVANAVTLLNPARVIMGGTVLWRSAELRRRVLEVYERCVNAPSGAACRIVEAELGDDAGVLGAASIAADAAAWSER